MALMCFQSALWLELCRVLPDWRHDRRRLEVQKSSRWRMSRAWRNSCCLWKRKSLKLRCYILKLKISQFSYLRLINYKWIRFCQFWSYSDPTRVNTKSFKSQYLGNLSVFFDKNFRIYSKWHGFFPPGIDFFRSQREMGRFLLKW